MNSALTSFIGSAYSPLNYHLCVSKDIRLLVHHFAMDYAARMNKRITAISEEFMTALVRHSWPGNVRELQTFIERSVLLASGDVLSGSRPEVTNTLKLSAPVTLEEAERSLYLLPHGRVAAWRSRNRNRDVWIVNGNAEPHLRV